MGLFKKKNKNESLLKTFDGREVKYELDKPEDSGSTFSQVLQEYVEPEETDVVLPDSE